MGKIIDHKYSKAQIEKLKFINSSLYFLKCYSFTFLYHVWEQQNKLLIRREVNLNFTKINERCEDYDDFKNIYKFHNIDISKYKEWDKIIELNLVCNVIKHGEGNSAKKLRKIFPKIFCNIHPLDSYLIVQDTLNLPESLLRNYVDILIKFWDFFPKYSASEPIDLSN
jgi:hypothetical protein